MPPYPAFDHIANGSIGDPKLPGQCPLVYGSTCFQLADARNLTRVKLDASRKLLPHSAAPLLPHVAHIVCLGPEKQVIRTNAQRVITSGAIVADEHSLRNGSAAQFPRDSMRKRWLPVYHEFSAPTATRPRRPEPAFSGAVDLFPETLCDGTSYPGVGAPLRTKPCKTSTDIGRTSGKPTAAHLADSLNWHLRMLSESEVGFYLESTPPTS